MQYIPKSHKHESQSQLKARKTFFSKKECLKVGTEKIESTADQNLDCFELKPNSIAVINGNLSHSIKSQCPLSYYMFAMVEGRTSKWESDNIFLRSAELPFQIMSLVDPTNKHV